MHHMVCRSNLSNNLPSVIFDLMTLTEIRRIEYCILYSYTSLSTAVSVIVGPWYPAFLSCINVDVHTDVHTHIAALFRDYPGQPVPER